MAKVRVKVSRAGVRAMLGQPFMVREVHRRAERVVRFGRFISPYATGQYSRSWFLVAGTRKGVAVARAGNNAPHAWFLENGTRDADGTVRMAARHIVKTALEAASD